MDESVLQEVAGIFERYHALGLFTHACAAFGSLRSPTLLFKHLQTPDGASVFDLASLTKAFVTTSLIFREVESGSVRLEHSVADWLGPELCRDLDPRLTTLSLRSLLRHETGLPAWRNFWVCHLGVEPEVEHDPLRQEPRLVEGLNRAAAAISEHKKQLYSDVGFLLLGLGLQRRSRMAIDELFAAFCRDDLKMPPAENILGYAPTLIDMKGVVPTAYCALRGRVLRGEVHDENCASLGGITGHAGLFGNVESMACFLYSLAQSNCGKTLLRVNREARVLPVGEPPNEPLVGWRQGADRSSISFREGRGMGHLGFTGVAFWVCPDSDEYAILLSNRVCNGRIRPEIVGFRRDVFAALSRLPS